MILGTGYIRYLLRIGQWSQMPNKCGKSHKAREVRSEETGRKHPFITVGKEIRDDHVSRDRGEDAEDV